MVLTLDKPKAASKDSFELPMDTAFSLIPINYIYTLENSIECTFDDSIG